MNLKEKTIFRFAIGFSLGMLICTIITSVVATNVMNDKTTYLCDPNFIKLIGNELLAFILQCIISGLYGGISFAATVVYDIEDANKWNILKATITHFFITVISFYITAFILRWIPLKNIKLNLIFLGLFIVSYFIIWVIIYFISKKEVNKIQKDIKKFQKKHTK